MEETVNPQPLKGRTYEKDVRRRAALVDGDDGGGFDAVEEAVNGGFEEVAQMKSRIAHRSNGSNNVKTVQASRTSELTIAFEGEVYVFPAVTPQKVQAVLLLLEGAEDTPSSSVPTSEFVLQQNSSSIDDMSRGSKISQRIASLLRFREKRKDRCFEKKIRYTCRKEVAERMHRKNGQFASLKEPDNTDFGKWELSNGTVHHESTPRACQHCGTSENATPAMRRGPAGPRTLCNACGLMWANKGTLRDLTKGGRHNSSDQNGPGTPDVKPSTVERENHYANQDEEESPEDTKPLPLDSERSLRPNEEELLETDGIITEPLPMRVDNSSLNLDEKDFQETLDELGNVSGSEFEIPEAFDDQVDVDDSDIGTEWPGT